MTPKLSRYAFTLLELIIIIAIILVLIGLLLPVSSCIVAGTPIDTPSGSRAIELLDVGDAVLSRTPNGKFQIARVTAKSVHSVHRYLRFVFNDKGELGATDEHPIATPMGWTKAGDLRVNDRVLGKSGERSITSIEPVSKHINVYDLTVEPNENFFAAGVLVHNKRRINRSRFALTQIVHVLEQYRLDFGSYPPDNSPTSNGSEILAYYLTRKLASGTQAFGPYLEYDSLKDADQNGFPELLSPLGNRYIYKLIGEGGSRAQVIDPGPDNQLGGTMTSIQGFVPDNSGYDKDNFYSIPPGQ